MRSLLLPGTLALATLSSCAPALSETKTRDGNPCDVATVPPALQQRALDMVADVVRGRLPGVRFFVRPYPVPTHNGTGRLVTSYRVPGPRALVVLSWRLDPGLKVEDISWEVEHLIQGTDDDGRPIVFTW